MKNKLLKISLLAASLFFVSPFVKAQETQLEQHKARVGKIYELNKKGQKGKFELMLYANQLSLDVAEKDKKIEELQKSLDEAAKTFNILTDSISSLNDELKSKNLDINSITNKVTQLEEQLKQSEVKTQNITSSVSAETKAKQTLNKICKAVLKNSGTQSVFYAKYVSQIGSESVMLKERDEDWIYIKNSNLSFAARIDVESGQVLSASIETEKAKYSLPKDYSSNDKNKLDDINRILDQVLSIANKHKDFKFVDYGPSRSSY